MLGEARIEEVVVKKSKAFLLPKSTESTPSGLAPPTYE